MENSLVKSKKSRAAALELGAGAVQILDEAAHVLRSAPAGAFLAYYAGSLPFVLGCIHFWSEMSRSAYADESCVRLSLGLSLAYVWMKTWQAVFSRKLGDVLRGRPSAPWTLRQASRAGIRQAFLQPTGFIVLPIALILTVPFAWVFAFYQNLTALADGDDPSARRLCRKAARQAALWPLQNHWILCTLCAFGAVVFLNCLTASILLPHAVKTLTGIETTFTLGWGALLNTTLLASVCGVAYLCLDPLVKAVYALRCFQGAAIRSGEDLLADLAAFTRRMRLAVLLAAAGAGILPGLGAQEAPEAGSAKASGIQAKDLDEAISRTLRKSDYAWRMPRDREDRRAAGESEGALKKFFADAGNFIRDATKEGAKKLAEIKDWLRRVFGSPDSPPAEGGSGWMDLQRGLLYGLLALVVCLLLLLGWRLWRPAGRTGELAAVAAAAVPNVSDESVTADQLPEDGWLRLAMDLLERGEDRMAIRALYLAGLARLGERGFIGIAKFKSNADYASEVERRAHALPGLAAAFRQNVAVFERVWYGIHAVTVEMVSAFRSNLEKLRTIRG